MKKQLLLLTFMMLGFFAIEKANAQACQASFTYSASGLTVTFTNTSSGAGIPMYSWNFGDGNYGYNTNEIHTYSSAGTYLVCLTMYDSLGVCNGYTSCDTITVTSSAGMFEYVSGGFSLYPNPANGNFTISMDENFQQAEVLLMDVLGNVVMTAKTNLKNTVMNTENLAAGIYNLLVKTENQTLTQRVVVAH